LFLDFDGVLNNERFLRHQRNHVATSEHRLFDPANLEALKRLCTDLPVETIVATSSWRLGRSITELRSMLAREGFAMSGLLKSVTINGGFDVSGRAQEILEYVAKREGLRWLAIDDLDLRFGLESGFFRTAASRGLTLELVGEIIETLGAEQLRR
jgi:hypothetical protein